MEERCRRTPFLLTPSSSNKWATTILLACRICRQHCHGRGTKAEVEALIHDTVELHLADLCKDGSAVSPPSNQVEYIEVAA